MNPKNYDWSLVVECNLALQDMGKGM